MQKSQALLLPSAKDLLTARLFLPGASEFLASRTNKKVELPRRFSTALHSPESHIFRVHPRKALFELRWRQESRPVDSAGALSGVVAPQRSFTIG